MNKSGASVLKWGLQWYVSLSLADMCSYTFTAKSLKTKIDTN